MHCPILEHDYVLLVGMACYKKKITSPGSGSQSASQSLVLRHMGMSFKHPKEATHSCNLVE